jgi:hypothetical protein
MNIDTRVVGYTFPGWFACASCVSDEPYTRDNDGTYHDGSHEHGTACEDGTGHCERETGSPVGYGHDDGYGLTCDDCYAEIFEVWPDVAHSEFGDHDDVTEPVDGCDPCADYFERHVEHANDAYNVGPVRFEHHCWTRAEQVAALSAEHGDGSHAVTTGTPNRDCPHCPPNWFAAPVRACDTLATDDDAHDYDAGCTHCINPDPHA